MVNDAILRSMTEEELSELVADALRDYKEQKELASSELAESSLVLDCLLSSEMPRPHLLALGVVALLRWAVDQLWQGPKPGGQERGWRLYAVLYYPYLERQTFEEVADQLALSIQAVYDWRLQALLEVAKLLHWELQQGQQHQQRKRYAIAERYWVYPPRPLDGADEQRMLRFYTLLRQPLPEPLLRELMSSIGVTEPQENLARLYDDGWLVQTGGDWATMLRADDVARAYLRSRMSATERRDWCNGLGRLYETRQDYLEAATQWCVAEQYQAAATTLIEHYHALVEAGQIRQLYELYELLENFFKTKLDENTLARLKIAVARAALMVENIQLPQPFATYEDTQIGKKKNTDKAKQLLEEALRAPDVLLKAQAYYQLGKILERSFLPGAEQNFNRGILLLETVDVAHDIQWTTLLADLYVGKAWLYILLLPDQSTGCFTARPRIDHQNPFKVVPLSMNRAGCFL